MSSVQSVPFGHVLHVFKHDLTKHIVYTVCIIFITTGITYFLLNSLLTKKLSMLPLPIEKTTIITTANTNSDSNARESMYLERGSPFDNRTIGSQSANVIFHGPRIKKEIALTFDAEMTDGMKANVLSGRVQSSYNEQIIKILHQTQTKATIFLTGMWIELYPQVTDQLSRDPLVEIGSHSYTDSSYSGFCYGLTQLSPVVRIEEIGATEKLIRQHAHIDNQLFRFPGGCYTPDDVALANQAGDTVVHWDVVASDGFNTNTQQIVHNVTDYVQNGSIVVMHINGAPTAPNTANALPSIISILKERGYTFVKVSELLGLPQEQQAQ